MQIAFKINTKKLFVKAIPVLVPVIIVAGILVYDNNQRNNSTPVVPEKTTDVKDNFQDYSKYIKDNSTTENTINQTVVDKSTLALPEAQQKTIQQGAWIPYWGTDDGIASLNAKTTQYSTISPVWYEINTNGSLINKRGSRATEMASICTKNNIELMPTIASFEWSTLSSILTSNTNTQTHIQAIVNEVVNNNYAGIDLDYESTQLSDKASYMSFISKLYTDLKSKGKKLSITVLPQWGDNVPYNALKETREVQDWAEISKYADQIRIMGYDYTSPSSKLPGPIGPLYWAEGVIQYAVQKIPREKIWYGVNLYGYEWSMTKPQDVNSEFIPSGNALATTYDAMSKVTGQESTESAYDKIAGEGVAKYDCYDGKLCISYFTTQDGIKDRLELGKKYGIAGLFYWRLGREGDLL